MNMKYLSKGNHHVALSKTTKYPTTLILRAVDFKIKPHSGQQRPQPDPNKKTFQRNVPRPKPRQRAGASDEKIYPQQLHEKRRPTGRHKHNRLVT